LADKTQLRDLVQLSLGAGSATLCARHPARPIGVSIDSRGDCAERLRRAVAILLTRSRAKAVDLPANRL
jgi:hypothetical protein